MYSFLSPSTLLPEQLWSWPWLWPCALSLSCLSLAALFLHSYLSNPLIGGLFSIPNALPIIGHLYLLGDDHASVCEKLWRKYNKSVFQIRLGNTTAVVVNSFHDARRILVSHQSALIDRPTLYTFHGVISSTQGFTIGSSPWDDSTRNRRRAAGTVLSRPAIRSYHDMFDLETYDLISDTYADGKGGKELEIRPYIQRLALNTTLTLCYGIRMRGVYDELLREILEVGSAISLLRSASENYQDYIPILRYLPGNKKTERAKSLRRRRDKYLSFLLDTVRDRIQMGTDKPCVSATILKGEETRLTDVEVSSICLSLVSGGFETIPATLTSCIGSLATEAGQIFQERAYEDIRRYYSNLDDIFLESFAEEKVPYVNALVKEAERYYTASAMNLPRKTTVDITWDNGVVIPAKTMVLVNLQAANHDVDHFGDDADVFNPERWLEYPENIPVERSIQGLPHMSFGAGARGCSGQFVANRVIYTALARLLSSYRVVASEEFPPNTHYADYNAIKSALVAIPRDFKVKLIPRDESELLACLKSGAKRTEKHYVV
ncbi:putative cytochrome P450 [Talaromyces proteolyticus]|uniref:Cytochrome P450 n=1 Tax=Talaromyces proteolyticus TaxID=1131652 RepID=A0AAD4PWH1_9EURO|nr:putative cytochrome P450 [Talaromyces proteolyticus]KAH8691524.1 putative cytochrome P450 [Talaromyces proteolyticus]